MRAIKCDRCGTLYSPSDHIERVNRGKIYEKPIKSIYSIDIYLKSMDSDVPYDIKSKELCEACYNSMLYYLNNPNTIVVSNSVL